MPHAEYSILTFDPREKEWRVDLLQCITDLCFHTNFRINERHNRGGKPCAFCIWDARFLCHWGGGGPQKYTVVMDRGEEEMMAQLHVLKTCIRLSVKQRRVSGLIYQIGNVCLAFIKWIPQGLWWGEAFIIICYNNAVDSWNCFYHFL